MLKRLTFTDLYVTSAAGLYIVGTGTIEICLLFRYNRYSGVVGRERIGTAFPHKKLSGLIIAIKFAIFHCYHVTAFRAFHHQNLQNISALKLISKGTCSFYKVNGYVVSQNAWISFKLITSNIGVIYKAKRR